MPPRLLEGVLRDVLGGGRVPDDGQRHAEDDPLEPAHERDGKLGIARAKASEQHFIGLPLS
jgi:hypothetical protein